MFLLGSVRFLCAEIAATLLDQEAPGLFKDSSLAINLFFVALQICEPNYRQVRV